jgi:hypothetical protein
VINYVVYNEITGVIRKSGICVTGDLSLQAKVDEQAVESDGTVTDQTHFWSNGFQLK